MVDLEVDKINNKNIELRKIILISIFVLIIFGTGFFVRFEATNLASVSPEEKSFYEDSNSMQYLQESDSYYNFRLTSNLLKNGYLGDKLINNTLMDLHSYYPPGVPLDYPPLIAWLSVSIYHFLNLFSSVSLLEVAFWLPALMASLAAVTGYLFVRRVAGELGGLFTGLLLVTSVFYYLKTVPGFFDTDMFTFIFPLVIIWSLYESNRSEIYRNKVIFAALAGFFMFLFAMAWNGWQLLFYCILISFILYYLLGKKRKWDLQHFSTVFFSFIATSLILIGLSYPLNLYKILVSPLEYFDVLTSSGNIWYPWPDSYMNVLELKHVSLERNIYLIGALTALFGIFGILITLWNDKTNFTKIKLGRFFFIVLIVWTIVSILSIFKGVRFVGLAIPPLSIFAGILVGIAYARFEASELPLSQFKKFIIGFLIVMLIAMPQIIDAYDTSRLITPFYNDSYADSATWINQNTPNGTVIITDWSYGHFYAAMADRPVSFDGRIAYIETLPVRRFQYGSLDMSTEIPNTSRDYWIDLGFSTNNSTLSRGIFTMLATTGDSAYLALENYTQNGTKSKEILKNILGLDKSSAEILLQDEYGLSENKAQKIINLIHPSINASFVLVTINGKPKYNQKSLNSTFEKAYSNKLITIYVG